MKKVLIIVSVFVFVVSCTRNNGDYSAMNKGELSQVKESKNELSPSEYVNWVTNPENGLIKKQEMEALSYSISYKPADYMACMEERKDNISSTELEEKRKEYSDLEYFELKIELENSQGELLKHGIPVSSSYDQRVNYCAFKMQKDIFMVQSGDTIPCSMFHFERAYDIAPYSKFLLAFNKNKNQNSDKTIVFDDKIFNNGILKFHFSQDELKNIPTLKAI